MDHLGIWRLSFLSLIHSLNPGQDSETAAVHSHVIKFHCQRWNKLVIQLLMIMFTLHTPLLWWGEFCIMTVRSVMVCKVLRSTMVCKSCYIDPSQLELSCLPAPVGSNSWPQFLERGLEEQPVLFETAAKWTQILRAGQSGVFHEY